MYVWDKQPYKPVKKVGGHSFKFSPAFNHK